MEKFGDDLIDLIVHYGDDEAKAKELSEKLKENLNIRNIKVIRLTPVLGVHTGPEIVAYVAKRVK